MILLAILTVTIRFDLFYAATPFGQLRLLPTVLAPGDPKPRSHPKVEHFKRELDKLMGEYIVETERVIRQLKQERADAKTIRELEEALESMKQKRRALNSKP